ncbi:MAG: trypsin-like serine protease [Parafilimonas terrae]|nr:trypsin-like serine protease [Parafilimonas terrae]
MAGRRVASGRIDGRIFIVLLALVGCLDAGGVAVAAEPHHQDVDATQFPWSSVAKLFNSVGGACTGAVIAPGRVLTAAHCLYAFRTKRFLQPDAIHVLLGYDRGDYREHARVVRYRIGPGYDPASERSTAAQDWAVLELAEPLPRSVRPLAVAAAVPTPATPIMVGGFARDRAYRMTADTACSVTAAAPARGLIAHGCVIGPGDSGAPLLRRTDDGGFEIVGVAVGIWKTAGRSINIAASMSPGVLAAALAPP